MGAMRKISHRLLSLDESDDDDDDVAGHLIRQGATELRRPSTTAGRKGSPPPPLQQDDGQRKSARHSLVSGCLQNDEILRQCRSFDVFCYLPRRLRNYFVQLDRSGCISFRDEVKGSYTFFYW